jgi:GDP-L-fucose synthase
MEKNARIYVAGEDTLIGAAIAGELAKRGFSRVLGGTGGNPDPSRRDEVERFFVGNKPEYVFLAAGKSGGIQANMRRPADLALDNLLCACSVMESAHRHGVKKLLYLASSCSYPRESPQPIREESLLTGPLEPTNEAYAVAKIAGLALARAYRDQYGDDFITGIPANAFGPGDDFSPGDSHVIAALIRRMHEAKKRGLDRVEIWGTGEPKRDFIFNEDLADACICVMERYFGREPINLSGGVGRSIMETALAICEAVGFKGEIMADPSKPDGMPLKVLDGSRIASLGWTPKTPFRDALAATYAWFLAH